MSDDQSTNEDAAGPVPGDSMDAVIEVDKRDVDRILLRENLKRTVVEQFLNVIYVNKSVDALREARAGKTRRRGHGPFGGCGDIVGLAGSFAFSSRQAVASSGLFVASAWAIRRSSASARMAPA